ncbi:MAG: biotin-dependent carboxyltransferase family protein [Alicyclobacillaceae bacterium]|nr:biotin-dependent carboxyltransferase family protein [Alicyclobacillaceae bacterium]
MKIVRAGFLSSIQDEGRIGYRKIGLSPGGAADGDALRLANACLGQSGESALEMGLVGAALEVRHKSVLVHMGAGMRASIDGWPWPSGKVVAVPPGVTVTFGTAERGVWAYLAVAGGFAVPEMLASQSTDLRTAFGGMGGRAVRAGDELPTRFDLGDKAYRHWARHGRPVHAVPGLYEATWSLSSTVCLSLQTTSDSLLSDNFSVDETHTGEKSEDAARELRFLRGPEWDIFSQTERIGWLRQRFLVSADSNRIGLRLQGQPLCLPHGRDMRSNPVAPGTVQISGDGQPMVLLADCQTVGGYPRIAHVCTADLGRAAQCRPGTSVRFREISRATAASLLQERQRMFHQVQWAVRSKYARGE